VASFLGVIRKGVFGISPDETSFDRRGFKSEDPERRRALESIGQTFVSGYHAALLDDDLLSLEAVLNEVEQEMRGFAYEGAAMALALLDFLSPLKRDRMSTFLNGPGASHVYMVYVGAGWAMARLPLGSRWVTRRFETMDPLLCWLAVDGYGFHEGYFHWPKSVGEQKKPSPLSGYAGRVFDQGLGRSLWFVKGADVQKIGMTIEAFSPERRDDLWGGLGLAAAYAGGVKRSDLEALLEISGTHVLQVAQGASFAAKARQRAGNPAAHTVLACEVLCGLSVDAAARITDDALEGLSSEGGEPAYEVWRCRIRSKFKNLIK